MNANLLFVLSDDRAVMPHAELFLLAIRFLILVFSGHKQVALENIAPRHRPGARSSAPRSPWQNCYVERLIGSIRRECLNHVIVLNDNHLRRLLKDYFRYITNTARICP